VLSDAKHPLECEAWEESKSKGDEEEEIKVHPLFVVHLRRKKK
jgi:hypothetical protein